jgi:predicted nucleic acid-binding protein
MKRTIMNEAFALDTNILVYLHDIDTGSPKRRIAYGLIADNPYISAQVTSEYLNVCLKKLKMPKHDALDSLMNWLPFCNLTAFNNDIYIKAQSLIKKYQFQLFDSIIIASAIESGCSVLFSEDMQHNLVVEKTLRIVNPFI